MNLHNLQHKSVALFSYAKRLCCGLVFLLFFTSKTFAQQPEKPEELGLMLTVPRVGSTEVSALIQGDTVYLSISNVFDYLKIKNQLSADLDSVNGFFLTPANTYTISKPKNKIFYQDKLYSLQSSSLLRTETDLYLRADYFGKIFGLDCEFDFRSLSITLKTKLELPVVREMQMEAIRKNISQLRGERKADTNIGRTFPLFRLGMADWGVTASRYANGIIDTRLSLAAGAMVLGGEANANLTITPGQPLDDRLQNYRWRYVNNNNELLRQISVGKVSSESISTLTSAVKGLQLTNAPTTYRKSFGTYTISNTTEPGWTVELYVNNILVNYTKADASGFYTFEVPLVYGSSAVKLRFYGPWGEEKTKEESIVVPFNFLPLNQFEYTFTGGLVKEGSENPYGRLSLKYGLANFLTVGGGMEYYGAVTSGRYMPYASAALRLMSRLILYGEHAMGVRTKAILNYRHRSDLQVDINYTKYNPEQTAVKVLEERRAVISMPFRGKSYSVFSRLTFMQSSEPKTKTTAAEFLLSSFFSGVSTNFTTYAILNQPQNPQLRSTLSLTFRLPKQIRFTQQMQYEYAARNFSIMRSEVEKTIFKTGFLTLSYDRNMIAKSNGFSVGLRLNLSGMQAAASAQQYGGLMTTSAALRGSLLYDDNISKLQFNNQSNVGRGALSIVPFLDVNCNGKRDPGEQKVCGLKLRINGGQITHCNKDTTIQIMGLEAYANYLLELDKNSFDNVAWQIKKPLINVVADPNYFKIIEVPVSVVGEVEGKVLMQSANGETGQGRVIVRFYKDGKQVAKVMTESDGYFDYMGFVPGTYTAEIDSEQLQKLNLVSMPGKLSFTINANKEGDLLQDLKFLLKKNDE
jgi:hypothetical protein